MRRDGRAPEGPGAAKAARLGKGRQGALARAFHPLLGPRPRPPTQGAPANEPPGTGAAGLSCRGAPSAVRGRGAVSDQPWLTLTNPG